MGTSFTAKRVLEAQLIAAPATYVLSELKAYGAALQASDRFFPQEMDDELEKSLLARNDPLIDMGLAQYATNGDVLKSLYRKTIASDTSSHLKTRYRNGLRVALLSNESPRGTAFSKFPAEMMGEAEFARLLVEGSDEELCALVTNPRVDEDVLRDLYLNAGVFAKLPDKRRWHLVYWSADNSRLSIDDSDEHGPDMGHMAIHGAIIKMLAAAPVDRVWLQTLRHLLEQLDPGRVSNPDGSIMPVIARWKALPEEEKPQEGYYTDGTLKDEFLCLVAAMYGRYYTHDADYKNYQGNVAGAANSADLYERCAFYGRGELTAELMKSAHARDGDFYSLAVLCNDSVLHKTPLRKLLEEEHVQGQLRFVYKRRCEQLAKRWRSFNPLPLTDWLAEDEDMVPAGQTVAHDPKVAAVETTVMQLKESIAGLKGLIVWALIILAGLVWFRTH